MGAKEQSGRTWSSFHLTRGTILVADLTLSLYDSAYDVVLYLLVGGPGSISQVYFVDPNYAGSAPLAYLNLLSHSI